jgi:hypothetical protein
MGRPTQGVKVMNMKEDDVVSAVALVVEDSTPAADEESNQEELPADASATASSDGEGSGD